MTPARRRLVLHIDGGAAPNPGPAAIGIVIHDGDGTLVEERAERIGSTSNNVAEYRALLRGLQRATALGAVPRAENARADRLVNEARDGLR